MPLRRSRSLVNGSSGSMAVASTSQSGTLLSGSHSPRQSKSWIPSRLRRKLDERELRKNSRANQYYQRGFTTPNGTPRNPSISSRLTEWTQSRSSCRVPDLSSLHRVSVARIDSSKRTADVRSKQDDYWSKCSHLTSFGWDPELDCFTTRSRAVSPNGSSSVGSPRDRLIKDDDLPSVWTGSGYGGIAASQRSVASKGGKLAWLGSKIPGTRGRRPSIASTGFGSESVLPQMSYSKPGYFARWYSDSKYSGALSYRPLSYITPVIDGVVESHKSYWDPDYDRLPESQKAGYAASAVWTAADYTDWAVRGTASGIYSVASGISEYLRSAASDWWYGDDTAKSGGRTQTETPQKKQPEEISGQVSGTDAETKDRSEGVQSQSKDVSSQVSGVASGTDQSVISGSQTEDQSSQVSRDDSGWDARARNGGGRFKRQEYVPSGKPPRKPKPKDWISDTTTRCGEGQKRRTEGNQNSSNLV